MSNRKNHDAKLEGCSGPFFPRSLDAVQTIRTTTTYFSRGAELEELAMRMPGFRIERLHTTTSDGYGWHWTLSFNIRNSVVYICLPYANDFKFGDGTQADRHVAMYVKGKGLDHGTREEFTLLLVEKMHLFIRELEARRVLHRVLREQFQGSQSPKQTAPAGIRGAFKRHFCQDVDPEVNFDQKPDPVLSATLEMIIDGTPTRIDGHYGQPAM